MIGAFNICSSVFAKTNSADAECARGLLISSRDMTKEARKFFEFNVSNHNYDKNPERWRNFYDMLTATEFVVAIINNGNKLDKDQIAMTNKISAIAKGDYDFQREEVEVLLRTIFKTSQGKALNKVEIDVLKEACGNNFVFDSFLESATIANASRSK